MAKSNNWAVWVSNNNPTSKYGWDKGWWDFVEIIHRLNSKLSPIECSVVSEYFITTPPPSESLLFPIVSIKTESCSFWLRHDFSGLWPNQWILSVELKDPISLEYLNKVMHEINRDSYPVNEATWVFNSYSAENACKFTCEVEDEWDLYTLLTSCILKSNFNKAL